MYKDLDFKRAVAKAENNVTLKMQLTRLGTNVEIDIEGVTFLFTLKNNSKSIVWFALNNYKVTYSVCIY